MGLLIKLLLGIFLFALFYFETLNVGGVKLAVLWKSLILISMFVVLMLKRHASMTKVVVLGYVFNIQLLLGISSLMNLPLLIASISRSIILPLSYQYCRSIVIQSRIEKTILFLSSFLVLSTIPFHLDLISPLSSGYDLSAYGTDAAGFVGIFQRAHPASASLAFAVIILVNAVLQSPKVSNKYFYTFLALIGAYSVVLTYVRTGLAMMAIGLVVLFFYHLSFRKMFLISIMCSLFASVLMSSIPVLKMRLLD